MFATHVGDPRLQILAVSEPVGEGVRPVVRLPRQAVPPALLVIAALILAATLFSILNERRLRREQPPIRASLSDTSAKAWPEPPPLLLPPAKVSAAAVLARPQTLPVAELGSRPAAMASAEARPRMSIASPPAISGPPAVFVPPPPPFTSGQPRGGAPLLVDGSFGPRPGFSPDVRASGAQSNDRVRASMLANPSLTVAQGSLIPAVLETGFDSTKPGFARAVVSRDVRGFDGKNVLIPRGSRLVGESRSSVTDGKHMVEINWSRLIRPDGSTIALDSPAVDPEGRAGVRASVNTHFLARVGDLIATTMGNLGQIFAARASPFIILSGNAASAGTRVAARAKRVPTLKVAPGTSISVFVAHDLEFNTPEDQR